jgi:acetylornithine deacetylase/succinyl-diaminopimelate desuccinylase-like protein
MEVNEKINDYLYKNSLYLQELAIEICKIPSMTGKEERKALFVKEKIFEITSKEVDIDSVGNIKYLLKGSSNEKMLILAAHIDTVFTDLNEIKVVIKENLIYGPSIGDNSINVAALILIIKLFTELNIKPERDILFVFDVGEEGLGNLKGIRNIMSDYANKSEAVIAVDGGYSSIVSTGVGSKRYSVGIKTEGGHSWNAFGNDNAIFYGSKLIQGLYNIKVPQNPKTTYNVGVIKGGTSVNTIAEDVEMIFDLRSIDRVALQALDSEFLQLIEDIRCEEIKIDIKVLGERPAGNCEDNCRLLNAICEVRSELGLPNDLNSGSTDANIAMSMSIPAVSFGIYQGKGAHTLNEYLDVNSLELGMKHLVEVLFKLV